jgi:hypothetical protein
MEAFLVYPACLAFLLVSLSICLSVCLSIRPSVRLSVCLSVSHNLDHKHSSDHKKFIRRSTNSASRFSQACAAYNYTSSKSTHMYCFHCNFMTSISFKKITPVPLR